MIYTRKSLDLQQTMLMFLAKSDRCKRSQREKAFVFRTFVYSILSEKKHCISWKFQRRMKTVNDSDMCSEVSDKSFKSLKSFTDICSEAGVWTPALYRSDLKFPHNIVFASEATKDLISLKTSESFIVFRKKFFSQDQKFPHNNTTVLFLEKYKGQKRSDFAINISIVCSFPNKSYKI